MKPYWTKTPPSVSGYYWAFGAEHGPFPHKKTIVHVNVGRLCESDRSKYKTPVTVLGRSESFPLSDFEEWSTDPLILFHWSEMSISPFRDDEFLQFDTWGDDGVEVK